MRHLSAIFVALTFAAAALPQAPPPDKVRDQVLRDWEAAMAKVTSFEATCERINWNKVFKTTEVYRGVIRYVKADPVAKTPRGASMKLQSVDRPADSEHLILSGDTVYDVSAAAKQIRVHKLPANGPANANDLLFGMTAADALKRFKVELVPASMPEQEKHYWFLRFEPKLAADKANFAAAKIVLTKSTNLPRQVVLQQVNGDTLTFDLPKIDTTVRLGAADFQPPQLPAGWKMVGPPVGPPGQP